MTGFGIPVPGVIGIVAVIASAALAAFAAHWVQAIAAGVAVVLLVVWLLLYTRVSAPINRQLTAAAEIDQVLPNVRALQANWEPDHQRPRHFAGLALVALCVALIV